MIIEEIKHYYTKKDYLVNGYNFRSEKFPKMYINVKLGFFFEPEAPGIKNKEIYYIKGATDDIRYDSIFLKMKDRDTIVIDHYQLRLDEYPDAIEIVNEFKTLLIEALSWLKDKGYKIHEATYYDEKRIRPEPLTDAQKLREQLEQMFTELEDEKKFKETIVDIKNI